MKYYNINTINPTKYWETNKILEFLNNSHKFTYNGKGCFKCENEYCFISLVYTNNFNSIASTNDFDDIKTNYISVVTSWDLSNEMMNLLKKLAQYLSAELVEEE